MGSWKAYFAFKWKPREVCLIMYKDKHKSFNSSRGHVGIKIENTILAYFGLNLHTFINYLIAIKQHKNQF